MKKKNIVFAIVFLVLGMSTFCAMAGPGPRHGYTSEIPNNSAFGFSRGNKNYVVNDLGTELLRVGNVDCDDLRLDEGTNYAIWPEDETTTGNTAGTFDGTDFIVVYGTPLGKSSNGVGSTTLRRFDIETKKCMYVKTDENLRDVNVDKVLMVAGRLVVVYHDKEYNTYYKTYDGYRFNESGGPTKIVCPLIGNFVVGDITALESPNPKNNQLGLAIVWLAKMKTACLTTYNVKVNAEGKIYFANSSYHLFPDTYQGVSIKDYCTSMAIASGNLSMLGLKGDNGNFISCVGFNPGNHHIAKYTFKIIKDNPTWELENFDVTRHALSYGDQNTKIIGWDENLTYVDHKTLSTAAVLRGPSDVDYPFIKQISKYFRVAIPADGFETSGHGDTFLWRNEQWISEKGEAAYDYITYSVTGQAKDLGYEPLSFLVPLFVMTGVPPGITSPLVGLFFEKGSSTSISNSVTKTSSSGIGAGLDYKENSSVTETTTSTYLNKSTSPFSVGSSYGTEGLSLSKDKIKEIPPEKQGFIIFQCPSKIVTQYLRKMINSDNYYQNITGEKYNPPKRHRSTIGLGQGLIHTAYNMADISARFLVPQKGEDGEITYPAFFPNKFLKGMKPDPARNFSDPYAWKNNNDKYNNTRTGYICEALQVSINSILATSGDTFISTKGFTKSTSRGMSFSITSKFSNVSGSDDVGYSGTKTVGFEDSLTATFKYGRFTEIPEGGAPKSINAVFVACPPGYNEIAGDYSEYVSYDNCPWLSDAFKDTGARPYLITWSTGY